MNANTDSEAARLAVAERYCVAEGSLDAALSEACRLAALLCHRPMAAVEFVLERQVILTATVGLEPGRVGREQALGSAFLDAQEVVVIPDARRDARLRDRALVREAPGVRFYAAVPLTTPERHVLGFLSVWDSETGELTPGQEESLEALGRMVMAQLHLGLRQRQLEELESEHARVEAALREAEAKYRGIFENTVLGIYQTTPEGRYLSANPMLAHIYGYASAEELIAGVGNIQEQVYVDPTARDRFVAALQKEDRIANFEAQIRRKDGRVIWIAETARVVRDPAGKVLFYEGTVQDVTARKAAEEQLRTSELLYHSLVEQLPQNIFRKDLNERFIFANIRFCETVGRPIEEILGRTDFDLFPEEDARKYQADDQQVINERRTLRVTERNETPHGPPHWVEVIKTPLRDGNGRVVGIQGIFWDVTERKRLQDEVAYERDLLQAFLDHSPDMIFFKDPQSRFVKAGRALAQRFGFADGEALAGKTSFDLLAPEAAQAVQQEEQEVLRTGRPVVNQVEAIVDQQGRRMWVSVTKIPIYDRAGEILGLVGVSRDVTKLIETEQALREAEERYRSIFENSVEGIFQTSTGGQFLRVNPALARIYGYASTSELMESLTDVRTQVYVDPGRREEFVKEVYERGSITGFESEIFRKDGTTTWVSESARIVRDREGRPAYFEGTLEDISARRQIDVEREKARQAAEESARMKSEFVATVSHEIRTPLNAILPNTERLLDTRLDRQQRYLAESIHHGAHLLLQIVNDVLDFSKIEAGAVTLEDIAFDLHEEVERTLSLFGSRAAAKRIELVGDIRDGVPRRVRGDPSRLGQILNNLLGNAVKFTEQGEVVLEVEEGPPRAGGIGLTFRVRDTGIGIASEARERVFQSFAQADGSMSRRYGGTGLGLAITRRLVELMGGEITFESEAGRGTTFSLTLTFQPGEADMPESAMSPVLKGRNVLVLEDNAAQRRTLGAWLLGLGAVSVVEAADVASALREIQSATRSGSPFGLIVYDAELEGGDALQTGQRLRLGGGFQADLIALVPAGSVASERGLAASGIRGVLVKPLRRTRLAADLAVLLDERGTEPAARVASEASPVSVPGPGQGLRVLVVEDNELNQRVGRELLIHQGALVEIASTGPAAIEEFRKRRYDLVLMDCQMPGMDGFEATRRLRAIEADRRASGCGGNPVPIVALSANALEGDREKGIQAGMDDYLTKPLRIPELQRVLRSAAGRKAVAVSAAESERPALAPELAPLSLPSPRPAGRGWPEDGIGGRFMGGPDESATVLAPLESDAAFDEPVLDPEPLAALASPDDPGVLAEFVSLFVGDAPGRIERLAGAATGGNADLLRAEAHSLKGNASNMGARRLAKACGQLEEAAKTGELTAAKAIVELVRREFELTRAALEREVAQRQGRV